MIFLVAELILLGLKNYSTKTSKKGTSQEIKLALLQTEWVSWIFSEYLWL